MRVHKLKPLEDCWITRPGGTKTRPYYNSGVGSDMPGQLFQFSDLPSSPAPEDLADIEEGVRAQARLEQLLAPPASLVRSPPVPAAAQSLLATNFPLSQ